MYQTYCRIRNFGLEAGLFQNRAMVEGTQAFFSRSRHAKGKKKRKNCTAQKCVGDMEVHHRHLARQEIIWRVSNGDSYFLAMVKGRIGTFSLVGPCEFLRLSHASENQKKPAIHERTEN